MDGRPVKAMLEELERLDADHRVHRFANVVDFSDMLRQMGLEI